MKGTINLPRIPQPARKWRGKCWAVGVTCTGLSTDGAFRVPTGLYKSRQPYKTFGWNGGSACETRQLKERCMIPSGFATLLASTRALSRCRTKQPCVSSLICWSGTGQKGVGRRAQRKYLRRTSIKITPGPSWMRRSWVRVVQWRHSYS